PGPNSRRRRAERAGSASVLHGGCMKQALFVMSGVAIGLLSALVAFGCSRSEILPQAEAQAGPAGGAGAGGPVVILATGGATPNTNDLCWVFRQEKGKNRAGEYDRTTLTLYKAANNGTSFDLVDTRETTWDGKPVQLSIGSHNKSLSPRQLKEAWEKEEREQRERDQREQQRPNNN